MINTVGLVDACFMIKPNVMFRDVNESVHRDIIMKATNNMQLYSSVEITNKMQLYSSVEITNNMQLYSSVEITKKMQPCNRIYYSTVH